MSLGKITVNNIVRCIPQSETNIKPNKIKAGTLPTKQNKNISQNDKKFLKNIAGGGIASLTK